MRAVTVVLLLGMAAGLVVGSGCIAATGNDTVQCKLPTLGEELTDLDKARESGAVAEQEYQRLRTRMMERDCHVCRHRKT